jgi:hypothetical protein
MAVCSQNAGFVRAGIFSQLPGAITQELHQTYHRVAATCTDTRVRTGLEAILVIDSGHFVTLERPRDMAMAAMCFFNSVLSSGLPLFDRSRHHGLPTKPAAGRDAWGVNAYREPAAE